MFRKYTPKDDVQKKSYYTDRFYVTPSIPKEEINEKNAEDVKTLEAKGIKVVQKYSQRGQSIIYINPKDNIHALTTLRDECDYEQMLEVSAIDYIARDNTFEVFYEMLSLTQNKRLRVKTKLSKDEHIESASSVYSLANWGERECYDMFGIIFSNHPKLKRVLMPDDWVGHPLLKTYPLQGDEFAQWYEVDLIYGKENRDLIGPEIRDGAWIDRYDTKRFSRLGKEVAYGAEYNEDEKPIEYLPDGVPVLSDDFDRKKQTTLKERK